jgi:hypothetical protein
MKKQFALVSDTVRQNVIAVIESLSVSSTHPFILEVREERRSDRQNRLMWPLLRDLSEQVVWHGEQLEREEWKDLITALVTRSRDEEQKSAPGISGGRVYFNVRTSKSGKRYMVEVIEAIYAFGIAQGVIFSEQSLQSIEWTKRWGGFSE